MGSVAYKVKIWRAVFIRVMFFSVLFLFFIAVSAKEKCTDAGLPFFGSCPSGTVQASFEGNDVCCPTNSVVKCIDKINPQNGISDCPQRRQYCNDAIYRSLMEDQCPKTCGFCSSSSSSTCVDKVNPKTGVSDCKAMASYCNNSDYFTLMTQECPKTCGRCP